MMVFGTTVYQAIPSHCNCSDCLTEFTTSLQAGCTALLVTVAVLCQPAIPPQHKSIITPEIVAYLCLFHSPSLTSSFPSHRLCHSPMCTYTQPHDAPHLQSTLWLS